ncbi:MAG: DUF3862 domain-containing protein [Gammaproteobacteria bacterium]|nr:DUF3862 domain-containing protein [Gammaproteobacteria bacterium]
MRTLIVLACLLALAGCSKLTEANYAKLKSGMTIEEVEAVLGSADQCDETFSFRQCQWGDANSNIRIKYLGNKVIGLSKKNLR